MRIFPEPSYFDSLFKMSQDTQATTASACDELAQKIRKQVEFYFNDSNFPKDKFLRGEAEKNPEGCKCYTLWNTWICKTDSQLF